MVCWVSAYMLDQRRWNKRISWAAHSRKQHYNSCNLYLHKLDDRQTHTNIVGLTSFLVNERVS